MTDIASLSIEIDASSGKPAKESLDDVTEASKKTEAATVSLEQAQINARATWTKQQEALARQREVLAEIPKDVQKVLDKYDPLGTKLRQLESDFANLDKAAASGGLGARNDHAVDAAYTALNAEIAKTKELMVAAGVAGGEGFEKAAVGAMNLGLNTSYARRELVILGREAVSGDFSRLPNTFVSLVAHSNLLSVLFNPITAGLLAAGAAVGVLAVAYQRGSAEMDEMNKAIAVTNNFAGVTRGSMLELARTVASAGTLTVGASKDIITTLVNSGRLGADTIRDIANLTDNFSSATGQNAEKAAHELIKIFDDPAKGAAELNKQFNFLSAAELDHIEHLSRMGEVTAAQLELSQKLNDFLPKATDNLGFLGKAWDEVKKAASAAWDSMLGVGREKTTEEQLKDAQDALKRIQAQNLGSEGLDQSQRRYPTAVNATEIARAQQLVGDLELKLLLEQNEAEDKRAAAAHNRADIEANDLAKKHSKLAEILAISDEIHKLESWSPGNSAQGAMRTQSITELQKKRDDLVNPNDLLKSTDSSLRKKADEDIKRVNDWAAQDEARTLQAIQAINEIEDKYDHATGAYAAREKEKREQLKATTEAEKEAHQMGAYNENLDYEAMVKASAARVKAEGQVARFAETTKARVDALRQEGEAYNKSKLEIAMGNEARIIENEFTKASIGLKGAELAKLKEVYELRKKQTAEQVEAKVVGKQIEENQKKEAAALLKIWDNFVMNVQHTLGSQLYEVMNGNFKDIGTAFGNMLKRMLADALAANLTRAMFGPTNTGQVGMIGQFLGFAAASQGGGAAAAAAVPVANGAYFDQGGIVNSPTRFQYAQGGSVNNGLMGEAGPEGVLPLRRDASGKLGVIASGSSGGRGVVVTYAPVYHIDARTDRAEIMSLVDKSVQRGNAELTDKLQRAGAI